MSARNLQARQEDLGCVVGGKDAWNRRMNGAKRRIGTGPVRILYVKQAFRNDEVAAPLKPPGSIPLPQQPVAFRNDEVAAPLKHSMRLVVGGYPSVTIKLRLH